MGVELRRGVAVDWPRGVVLEGRGGKLASDANSRAWYVRAWPAESGLEEWKA